MAMAPGEMSHTEYLARRRDHLLAELARIAPQQTAELVSVLAAQEHLREQGKPTGSEYSGYRQAIDAIEAHLLKHGSARRLPEIEYALVTGGFGPHDERRHLAVRDAVHYHTRSKTQRLKRFADGRIGLPSWSDDSPAVQPQSQSQSQG